jgi:hypothetical protein
MIPVLIDPLDLGTNLHAQYLDEILGGGFKDQF